MKDPTGPLNEHAPCLRCRRSVYRPFLAVTGVMLVLTGENALHARGAHAADATSPSGVDVVALANLVRAQARQIHDLQARLAAVETRTRHGEEPGRHAVSHPASYRPETTAGAQAAPARLVDAASRPGPRTVPTGAQQGRTAPPAVMTAAATPDGWVQPRIGNDGTSIHMVYPLQAAPPGSLGAVSAMPSGSSPVMGVESSIPYSGRTTKVGGLILKWGKGLPEITTPDDQYSFKMRGRILADYGGAFGSRYQDQNVSRTILRAVRLGVEGRAKQLSWVFEGDYSDNDVTVVSAYATWSDRMAGHLVEYTLGNKFNERGFDGSTGSAESVFLDRDIVANAILPVKGWYGLGGAFKIFGKSWHVAAQITGDDVNSANADQNLRDDLTYELRTHWIPWRNKDGLIHLGAWGFYEDVKPGAKFSQRIRILARTDDAFAARINTIPLANSAAGGLELFGIWKTSWILGEYGVRHMQFRRSFGDVSFGDHTGTVQAASVQAGLFLTGETPNYFAHTGQWAAPRVLDPVTDGGWGAWEVALRGDWLDAWSVPGGSRSSSVTAGINWYLVNYMRMMLNYTHAHVNNKSGPYPGATGGNIVGMRMGITF
ncbi:porin [Gluconacetobacter sp.]|uniref:porin n=1 Tax=Gluconacetobacter sp. TaxID=1935994 RepID=UPI0039E84705